ncbi:hypothetical protein C3L33_00299, partial [Rhododendron williamsianum]
MVGNSPGNDAAGMNFEETELTLGLPGECRSQSPGGTKRGFSETVELKLGSSVDESCEDGENSEISQTAKSPTTKAQVVGWPPVRSSRKNMAVVKSSCKYVKVAVDGAPYLRKVDLETMFVESCKRLRLMKSSEAIGLACLQCAVAVAALRLASAVRRVAAVAAPSTGLRPSST